VIATIGRLLAPYALKFLLWGAIVAAVAAILLGAKRAGRAEVVVDSLRWQLKNVEERNEAARAVRAADPVERGRLRDKWTRRP